MSTPEDKTSKESKTDLSDPNRKKLLSGITAGVKLKPVEKTEKKPTDASVTIESVSDMPSYSSALEKVLKRLPEEDKKNFTETLKNFISDLKDLDDADEIKRKKDSAISKLEKINIEKNNIIIIFEWIAKEQIESEGFFELEECQRRLKKITEASSEPKSLQPEKPKSVDSITSQRKYIEKLSASVDASNKFFDENKETIDGFKSRVRELEVLLQKVTDDTTQQQKKQETRKELEEIQKEIHEFDLREISMLENQRLLAEAAQVLKNMEEAEKERIEREKVDALSISTKTTSVPKIKKTSSKKEEELSAEIAHLEQAVALLEGMQKIEAAVSGSEKKTDSSEANKKNLETKKEALKKLQANISEAEKKFQAIKEQFDSILSLEEQCVMVARAIKDTKIEKKDEKEHYQALLNALFETFPEEMKAKVKTEIETDVKVRTETLVHPKPTTTTAPATAPSISEAIRALREYLDKVKLEIDVMDSEDESVIYLAFHREYDPQQAKEALSELKEILKSSDVELKSVTDEETQKERFYLAIQKNDKLGTLINLNSREKDALAEQAQLEKKQHKAAAATAAREQQEKEREEARLRAVAKANAKAKAAEEKAAAEAKREAENREAIEGKPRSEVELESIRETIQEFLDKDKEKEPSDLAGILLERGQDERGMSVIYLGFGKGSEPALANPLIDKLKKALEGSEITPIIADSDAGKILVIKDVDTLKMKLTNLKPIVTPPKPILEQHHNILHAYEAQKDNTASPTTSVDNTLTGVTAEQWEEIKTQVVEKNPGDTVTVNKEDTKIKLEDAKIDIEKRDAEVTVLSRDKSANIETLVNNLVKNYKITAAVLDKKECAIGHSPSAEVTAKLITALDAPPPIKPIISGKVLKDLEEKAKTVDACKAALELYTKFDENHPELAAKTASKPAPMG